jgi:hypothetical protein
MKMTVLPSTLDMRRTSRFICSRVMASMSRKGLVHEEQRRIVEEGPHDRHALAHSARELAREPVGEVGQTYPVEQLQCPRPVRTLRQAAYLGLQQDVLKGCAPRQQEISLEDRPYFGHWASHLPAEHRHAALGSRYKAAHDG